MKKFLIVTLTVLVLAAIAIVIVLTVGRVRTHRGSADECPYEYSFSEIPEGIQLTIKGDAGEGGWLVSGTKGLFSVEPMDISKKRSTYLIKALELGVADISFTKDNCEVLTFSLFSDGDGKIALRGENYEKNENRQKLDAYADEMNAILSGEVEGSTEDIMKKMVEEGLVDPATAVNEDRSDLGSVTGEEVVKVEEAEDKGDFEAAEAVIGEFTSPDGVEIIHSGVGTNGMIGAETAEFQLKYNDMYFSVSATKGTGFYDLAVKELGSSDKIIYNTQGEGGIAVFVAKSGNTYMLQTDNAEKMKELAELEW